MHVNSIANNPNYQSSKMSFKGRELVSEKEYPDYIEKRYKTDASTGKKWGVGIASAFITGLGQFINGDVGKGFAFLVAGIVSGFVLTKNMTLGYVASLAVRILSIVDAVKNAKTKVVETVPKKTESEKNS